MEDKKPRSTEEIEHEKKLEFKKFEDLLNESTSVAEAWAVVAKSPPPDNQGHKLYTRLGFLLKSQVLPITASREEKVLYARFIGRIRSEIGQETAQKIVAEIQNDLASNGQFS